MTHSKVDLSPHHDNNSRKKPGDFEPPLSTNEPLVVQPPAAAPQSAPCKSESRDVEPRS